MGSWASSSLGGSATPDRVSLFFFFLSLFFLEKKKQVVFAQRPLTENGAGVSTTAPSQRAVAVPTSLAKEKEREAAPKKERSLFFLRRKHAESQWSRASRGMTKKGKGPNCD
nr:hypothetical protein [Pandoravirus massiliensis]